jgi:hypothetical protein
VLRNYVANAFKFQEESKTIGYKFGLECPFAKSVGDMSTLLQKLYFKVHSTKNKVEAHIELNF